MAWEFKDCQRTMPGIEKPIGEQVMSFSWGLRILVVDDDLPCLESIESCLLSDGHKVLTATGGLEALDRARHLRRENQGLDLSILDFHMHDLTGIETFARLLEEFPRVAGIFISGDASLSLERLVREAGGRALVPKPLDFFRVRSLISELHEERGDA
jgi:two-component system OmpR family response regulator